jgi:hypothetical protein
MSAGFLQPKTFAAAVLTACAFALGGCGGVQFEGRAFDAIGLGKKDEYVEKKMEDRAPLIVPPAPKLREPGPREKIAEPQNWPVDPERKEAKEVAAAEAEKEKYYDKGDWSDKRDIDEFNKLFDEQKRRPGVFGDGPVNQNNRGEAPVEGNAQ